MVEWNRIFRLFRFSGILGQPRDFVPKFWEYGNEIPKNVCPIRSPTRNFRNFWSNGKRPKTRDRNHLKSLRNEQYKHKTELSKHVWNLKKENRQFLIRWAIVKQTPAGRNGKRNCALCLEEKLMIMKGRSKNILNRRSEMFTKCRHVI